MLFDRSDAEWDYVTIGRGEGVWMMIGTEIPLVSIIWWCVMSRGIESIDVLACLSGGLNLLSTPSPPISVLR
jgi:hypothetical protein